MSPLLGTPTTGQCRVTTVCKLRRKHHLFLYVVSPGRSSFLNNGVNSRLSELNIKEVLNGVDVSVQNWHSRGKDGSGVCH